MVTARKGHTQPGLPARGTLGSLALWLPTPLMWGSSDGEHPCPLHWLVPTARRVWGVISAAPSPVLTCLMGLDPSVNQGVPSAELPGPLCHCFSSLHRARGVRASPSDTCEQNRVTSPVNGLSLSLGSHCLGSHCHWALTVSGLWAWRGSHSNPSKRHKGQTSQSA